MLATVSTLRPKVDREDTSGDLEVSLKALHKLSLPAIDVIRNHVAEDRQERNPHSVSHFPELRRIDPKDPPNLAGQRNAIHLLHQVMADAAAYQHPDIRPGATLRSLCDTLRDKNPMELAFANRFPRVLF